jgi:hypothetical protein
MRQLIHKRQLEGTPRSRPRSFVPELSTPGPPATPSASNVSRLDESVSDVDKLLASALSNHEILHKSLMQVVSDFKEVGKHSISLSRYSPFPHRNYLN